MALSNHRRELLLVDLRGGTLTTLDRSDWRQIAGMDWSPDGRLTPMAATGYNATEIASCTCRRRRMTSAEPGPMLPMTRRRKAKSQPIRDRPGLPSRVRARCLTFALRPDCAHFLLISNTIATSTRLRQPAFD